MSITQQRFDEIQQARKLRKDTSRNLHMGPQFSVLPLQTLEELQAVISTYNTIIELGGEPGSTEAQNKKAEIQAKIDNNEFCTPNTPEWTYRENWKAQAATWGWPTIEEQALYEQEDQEIFGV
jgi:hypothetical protein